MADAAGEPLPPARRSMRQPTPAAAAAAGPTNGSLNRRRNTTTSTRDRPSAVRACLRRIRSTGRTRCLFITGVITIATTRARTLRCCAAPTDASALGHQAQSARADIECKHGGIGDVEALDLARHVEPCNRAAGLAGQLTQAL